MSSFARALLVLLTATLGSPVPAAADAAQTTVGPETELLYLSGRGPSDAVTWKFRCLSEGRGCPEGDAWATVEVPSQWEQQGFLTYDYGHDDDKAEDAGVYRTSFTAPSRWQGRRVELVFGGVMTDTEAKIDGEVVGPVHQGGFTRFRYDVTEFVRPGVEQMLEVAVHEQSANRSVNEAERDADYWTFGGIYRPVWLRALPAASIDHVAVDARHDGELGAWVRTVDAWLGDVVRLTVAGQTVLAPVVATDERVPIGHRFFGIEPWSAERPRLYDAVFELLRGGEVLHRTTERVGFRTVEWVMPPHLATHQRWPGLYVNGERVLLRGVNRHSFWPDTGRAVDPQLDRADVRRMRSMNLNAVRTSHYPPNEAFLDACDELGLYVIDELPGWHDAYDTKVGRPLVREMVERDVNHPSILIWSNGNEDGWNTDLDDEFALHDPQQRRVIHPRSVFRDVDAPHYDTWRELDERLQGPSGWRSLLDLFGGPPPLVMPTEILHGLYDGGSAAGLARYWQRLRLHPRTVGLFLWAFTDEAVARTDRTPGDADHLDTDGNHAPDGILGPYREASANEAAIREIFAPDGTVAETEPLGHALLEARRTVGFDLGPSGSEVSEAPPDWLPFDEPAAQGEGKVRRLRWQPWNSGWVRLSWIVHYDEPVRLPGLVLPLDEGQVRSVSWLGLGPHRVWRNRIHGTWGRHEHAPWSHDAGVRWAHEPKPRGYRVARQLTVELDDGTLDLVFERDRAEPGRFVGLFNPSFPDDALTACAESFSPEGIALLEQIPAIGTKFHTGAEIDPRTEDPEPPGLYQGVVWLRFLPRALAGDDAYTAESAGP